MSVRRKLLAVLLGLGALAGFVGGAASMHRRHHHRHQRFEDRVADVCVRAAERSRVYDQGPPHAPPGDR